MCCKGERRQWRIQRTEAGAAVAECEGLLSPKHDAGTATRHWRAFWQRRCRAAAAGAVLKPLGGNCAVLPYMLAGSLLPTTHSHTGLFVDGSSFHYKFLPLKSNAFSKKAGHRLPGTPLQILFYARLAHRKGSTGCRGTLHMHIIIIALLRIIGLYSFPQECVAVWFL